MVRHQVSLVASDTIKSLFLVMREAMECGVELKRFHTNNGIFKSKAFVEALKDNCQMITKSGAGAHHQNGVAWRVPCSFMCGCTGPMNLIQHYCASLSTTLSKFATTCHPRSRMGCCVQNRCLRASFLAVAHSNNCVSPAVHVMHSRFHMMP